MELCLTAIVRDEAPIIARMLASVRPHISSYSISDTGSVDDTMDIIRREMNGIPGVLMSDPWVDFATNRNLALSRATGTHALTIDADEVLWRTGNDFPEADRISIKMNHAGLEWWSPRIIKNNGTCKWVGELHELPEGDGVTDAMSDYFEIQSIGDGHRSTGNKAEASLAVLETMEQSPRTVFYRARTLYELQRYRESISFFEEHVRTDAADEEKYISYYQIAAALKELGEPSLTALARAYEFRPRRAEALLELHKEISRCVSDFIPAPDTLFCDPNAERKIQELQHGR